MLLSRNTRIDAFIKHTAGWIGRQLGLILLEHGNVMIGESFNLVNVFYSFVGSVAGNLSSGVREHARELHIVALYTKCELDDDKEK